MMTISDYIAGYRERLAQCRTRNEIACLWQHEDILRKAVGIQPNGFIWGELYSEWVARGREISTHSFIERERQ